MPFRQPFSRSPISPVARPVQWTVQEQSTQGRQGGLRGSLSHFHHYNFAFSKEVGKNSGSASRNKPHTHLLRAESAFNNLFSKTHVFIVTCRASSTHATPLTKTPKTATNEISLPGCFQRVRSCASRGISFPFLKKPYYYSHLTDGETKASRDLKM